MKKCEICGTMYETDCYVCSSESFAKTIPDDILDLLEPLDFTWACNGRRNIHGHVKRLVDFYLEHNEAVYGKIKEDRDDNL